MCAEIIENSVPFSESISNCALRDLPKITSKYLIQGRQTSSSNFSNEICLKSFAIKVSELNVGIAMELWKTFLYHMERDVIESDDTKSENMALILDHLMSSFLDNVCLVNQGMPPKTMEKIIQLVVRTQNQIQSIKRKQKSLPILCVQKSLFEFAIMIKNFNQVTIPEVINLLEKEKSLKLLKRKLLSIEASDVGPKKQKLSFKDLLENEDTDFLVCIVDELSDKDLNKVGNFIFDNEEFLRTNFQIINENIRAQSAFLFVLFDRILQNIDCSDQSFQFIKHLSDAVSSPQGSTETIKNASTVLTNILSEKTSVSVNRKIIERVLEIFEMLPLEHLRGSLEMATTLLALWMTTVVKLKKSSHELLDRIITCLSRTLDLTLRIPTILKSVPYTVIVLSLARVKLKDEKSVATFLVIVQSLSKLTCMFQKTLGDLAESSGEILKPLSSFDDPSLARVSVVTMESLSHHICSKETSEEKRTVCWEIFKQIFESPSYICLQSDSNSLEISCLNLRLLIAILDVKSYAETLGIDMKKWFKCLDGFMIFASAQLSTEITDNLKAVCCKFLTHIWTLRGEIDKVPQNFFSEIMRKIADGRNRIFDSEAGLNFAAKLFNDCDDVFLKEFTSVLLDNTLEATIGQRNFHHLSNVWCLLISQPLTKKKVFEARRDGLFHVLQVLQQVFPVYNVAFVKDCLLPILTLEASLLEAEKPLVSRETESMCLMNSATINLVEVYKISMDCFCDVWMSIHRILSASFHKRSSSVVVPRIPLVASVFRNLLTSLGKAADQRQKLSDLEIKKLVFLSHYIDRLCEHVRRLKEDFARVAPYLIVDVVEFFYLQTVYIPVKANVLIALKKLIDLCDKHSIEMLMGILPTGRREIFGNVVLEVRKHSKNPKKNLAVGQSI